MFSNDSGKKAINFMSLKIILTSVCLCSLAALCLQGVVPRASATALGVHRAKCCCSEPICLQCPTPLPALVTAFVFAALPCTFLRNSDLDYTPNLVQEWWKVQSSKEDNGLFQLESSSRGLGKIYIALGTAATGWQRIHWSKPSSDLSFTSSPPLLP